MEVVVGIAQLLCILFFVALLVWAIASRALHLEDLRTYWRMKPFAWTGFAGIPVLVAWNAARGRMTTEDGIGLALLWVCFGALLRWVSRPPAPRAGADDGTRTPS